MNNRYIIVDIDGTLANIDHRRHYVESSPKKWNKFFRLIPEDIPNQWCIDIIKCLKSWENIKTILCTGRMYKHGYETEEWLKKYDINYEMIFYRKDGDFRSDDIVKQEIYEQKIKHLFSPILFVIDDRKQVVDMWRKQGLTCLQCAEGNF